MNKKGQGITQLFILIAISMVLILFFSVWIFGFNTLTNAMEDIELPASTGINFTDITKDTLSHVNSGMAFLRIIAVLMIFGFSLSIIITSFVDKVHPGLGFVVHLFVTAIAVVFAVQVSNAYEALLTNNVLGETLQSFTGGTFIMLNLPVWVTVIGFIGIILLMSGIPKDRLLGGGTVK